MSNRRFPNYPDDTDYNTNSSSYYDDLARKQKLIQLLAEKIWDYEKTLDENLKEIRKTMQYYVSEWDKRIDEMPDEMAHMFVEWLDDGTLAQIINNDVLDMKSEIIVSEFEPLNIGKNAYWFKDLGESMLDVNQTIINTNVAVSEDEPLEPDKNVWFDL